MIEVHDLRAQLEHHLERLPVLPGVLVQLLALDRASPDFPDRVAALVETEPNFSTRVLAVANSAASAPVDPIDSVVGAVARIGAAGAADLVMTLGVTSVFVPRDDWDRSLWRHSLQVAVMSRLLAQAAPAGGVRGEVAHTAGLIHDVGRFILFQLAPAALRRIDEGEWSTPEELVAEEMRITGIDHTELGARACEGWGIPSSLTDVVRLHHRPPASARSAHELHMIQLVHVADRLVFASTSPGARSSSPDDAIGAVVEELPEWIRLDAPRLEELRGLALAEADRLGRSIGV